MSKVDPTIREMVRDETAARFSRRYQTQVPLGTSDGSKGRCHIDDQMLPLRTHLDDQQFDREDEFVFFNLIEEARYSLTCEILSPEEMLIRREEEDLDEGDPAVESGEKESDKTKEEQEAPAELNLVDYFAHLFGITSADHVEFDEHHHRIPCNEAPIRYRSRPNWATT